MFAECREAEVIDTGEGRGAVTIVITVGGHTRVIHAERVWWTGDAPTLASQRYTQVTYTALIIFTVDIETAVSCEHTTLTLTACSYRAITVSSTLWCRLAAVLNTFKPWPALITVATGALYTELF